jgi:hypothetical protein
VSNRISPLEVAFWLLVFVGTLPALIYLAFLVQSGIRGEAFVQPVFFKEYYGFGFILIFTCIAWLAQQLRFRWGIILGLPALFVGVYPAMLNFGSEKLVSGAVVAFDLDNCPAGWDTYEAAKARVIVGAGKGTADERGRALSERVRGKTGGEEVHQLTVAEMPKHNHSKGDFKFLLKIDRNGTAIDTDPLGDGQPNLLAGGENEPRGGDAAHNSMPPFVVLTFCVKH